MGATQPAGDPSSKISRGFPRERQHQDAVWRSASALDPIHYALDQSRGLAGGRTCQDQ